MNKKRRLFIVIGILILGTLVCVISVILINYKISGKYRNRIYDITNIPFREVGLILGAQVWSNNTPSHILEDRLLVGIELYKKGKVRKLILSGDHGTKTYDEVNTMRRFVLERGVKENDIFMDHAGFRTYDSCYRARDVFGVRSMVIITNEFHLPRALYIANELGIDAVGVPSDPRPYREETYNKSREFLARIKAYLDVNIFKTEPKFLGPKIDIQGSGLVTKG